ncbi:MULTISPECIES: hypothetical protein [Eisenbergiella]|uniref:hypothetical protein n=1 Tax=Eisenbergiella TaxID=1432051 RepID=UPI001F43763E|nr:MULTISPECIES: hypothetical protein [Eisenbergiella]MDY2654242.1 hypothetical protein [Eisenbergiella porci]
MIITDFRYEHIPEAEALALSCYDEERREVPALPEIHSVPALKDFADNHMGAAALENGRLVGFLCSVAPFDNVFRSTDVKGVFSPMLANAPFWKTGPQSMPHCISTLRLSGCRRERTAMRSAFMPMMKLPWGSFSVMDSACAAWIQSGQCSGWIQCSSWIRCGGFMNRRLESCYRRILSAGI